MWTIISDVKNWQLIASLASVVALFRLYKQLSDTKKANTYANTNNARDLFFSNSLDESKLLCFMLQNKYKNNQYIVDQFSNQLMELLLFFENLGLSVNKKICDPYMIWTIFGDEIRVYYYILYPVIKHFREEWNDKALYCEFEKLFKMTAKLNKRYGGHEISKEDIELFFDGEMKIKLERYCNENSWYMILERMSFPLVDQMSESDFTQFVSKPENIVLIISIFRKNIGAFALTIKNAETIYIESFAILPSYRGLKLGGKSLDSLFVYCSSWGFKYITLHVRVSTYAKELYIKKGFISVFETNDIYSDNEKALYLQKKL